MSNRFRSDVYDEFMKQYKKDHQCCPNCGSKALMTTLVAYLADYGNLSSYVDKNRATCLKSDELDLNGCEWSGIVHDLISEESYKSRIRDEKLNLLFS